MSYINDALRKAQKENRSDSAYLSNLLPPANEETHKFSARFWALALVVVLLLAGVFFAVLQWTGGKRTASQVAAAPGIAKNIVKPEPSVPPAVPPPAVSPALPAAPNVPVQAAPVTAQDVPSMEQPRDISKNRLEAVEKPMKKASRAEEGKSRAEKKPGNPKLLYAQALKKQKEGRMEQAKALYEQILKIEPRHLAAINNLGVVYMQQNDYKKAIARFNQAIAIKRDYVDGHYNLACLYAKKNDTKQSLFYLKNAIDINPEVKIWAENDDDLKKLASLPDFQKLLQKQDN